MSRLSGCFTTVSYIFAPTRWTEDRSGLHAVVFDIWTTLVSFNAKSVSYFKVTQTGAPRRIVLMPITGNIGTLRFSRSGRWSANPGSWKRSKIDPISCESILTTLFPQASATDLPRTVLNSVYFPGSIVAGHMSINRADSEWQLLLDAIREVHEDVPVFIFGGHNHVRNCERLDGNSIS